MAFITPILFWVLAVLWSLLLGLAAAGLAGLGVVLMASGKNLILSVRVLPFWPEWLGAWQLMAQAAPWMLAGGVALLLVGLPLSLAFLETLSLRLTPPKGQT